MNETKFVVRVAMCVALLIAGQVALSSVAGIEIVTVMLLCFCWCYGVRHGLAIATTFSLLRCFVFGFQVNVIVLYLVYYNLFALFFGWLGARLTGKNALMKTVIAVASAVIFTVMFTLLDDVITPLISGFTANAAKVYFYQSLAAVIPQTICAAVTVSLLFHPLTKVIQKVNF
ncbi:MAG: hypothetical protein E7447_00800 [Ruminococcaceae bacterium]|nr:hypothetical protein [Oscillospiraceae bacterium]